MMISRWTQRIEKLACRSTLWYRLTRLYYKKMVQREVDLAGITADDRVLVVGGGPCPHSGILLHQLTGAQVTIIDNEQSCVSCARQLVDKLGLRSRVDVVLQDGQNICPAGYSAIHVALQIQPKDTVVAHFCQRADQGTRLLVRMPKKAVSAMYSPLTQGAAGHSKARHGFFSNVDHTQLHKVRSQRYAQQAS